MAKRFTDTGKWDKGSFSDLTPKMKLAWVYLCDKCDHAGIWDVNLKLMAFQTGEIYTIDELKGAFSGKIHVLSDTKIFIQPFVEFQYGQLVEENRAHKSVIIRLVKEGAYKVLNRSLQGRKDKDKDKESVLREVILIWNNNCGSLSKIEKLTDKRRRALRAQLEKYPSSEHWLSSLTKLTSSDFVQNEWRPTFDDFLKEDIRIKALEGKYVDRKKKLVAVPSDSFCGVADV